MQSTTSLTKEFDSYIGGEFVPTANRDTIRLPYDGTAVASVPRVTAQMVNAAVDAAQKGARAMATLANYDRADLLQRVAEFIRRDADDFAQLVCSETGKPIKEARVEVDRSIQTTLAAAHEARQLRGEVVPMEFAPGGRGRMAVTVREPLGVIGAITPFNLPLNLAMHKIAPALAGGNSVVHKPSEQTPLSALRLAQTLHEAKVPAGAYNVVTGDGTELGEAMVRHEGIAMITFTGSVRVGKWIRANAGLKKVTLEMGNNSAVILEPDSDLDIAVPRTVQGTFTHSGQVCISVQRVYVHEKIADTFVDQLVAATKKLRIGHPYEDATDISSLIAETQAVRVQEWIEEAQASGARVLTGGKRERATIEPTVLADVPLGAKVSCQEVFGPVVAIYRYSDLNEAIERVNDTPYGLQAGIFTRDMQRAFDAARKLHFGGVLINDVPMFRVDHMPYGGVKESGIGREGPKYAIEEMTEPKIICWRM
jgi:acyl-CoA reductase-like NAD-dependent aldehyde dehydrogenase